ncbi:MBL fold metallo-hydrolase [Marinobacterium aestuarii]|uniref:MBL fold metallo-hydrolase n=1 Tax=Marinobacterium aestuarii TaxID=1821621 RepID=A0A1A9F300_9GAMM|nr:MBL fold metallo-hydrolase [Marinobacterium aestuarii]ANG64113.1 MBL fold metallo-hydrolase [Marinobacterium aestuarii]
MKKPDITSFFDEATNNVSHIVTDPDSRSCAIIDSLLDYDAASGRTSTASADRLIAHVKAQGLTTQWIIDTHVHADHLSAAHYLKTQLGGRTGIGEQITQVQKIFAKLFNAEAAFRTDGSQFDHLFRDGENYRVGSLEARALHTPGHTPACMTHVIADAAFVGDTLFMPDYGTARADFPGGDAQALYRSIQKVFALPPDTRIFLNHDYLPDGRNSICWESTVAEQRRSNIHVHKGISEADFVQMRNARDKTLPTPKLMVPSVQINIRAGAFPAPEDNGVSYIKVPVNLL